MNRGAEPVSWDLCEILNVSGAFDVLTSKCIIEKSIFENILNKAKTQVIVPLCVGENRSASVRMVQFDLGCASYGMPLFLLPLLSLCVTRGCREHCRMP